MKVRVRFAPSPTGGLHLGGVRTVLYNYLFARHHDGDFVLRVEDTDQNRYVPGAEEYIMDCLEWCGLIPDESPATGGPYVPYRQSERKPLYAQYAKKLVDCGAAYYAFDTPEELEKMRNEHKDDPHAHAQYDDRTRIKMRNSLSLPIEEVNALIAAGTPYVIRIKMPANGVVAFDDMIRGHITFDCSQVDDKVLLKADGMPTYHLAVVVDDYLMKITHAFRGEEWLPSAPVHLLLWKHLGWEKDMPKWAHLPLILKPDGNGKLSKRDGDRLGFPVFAMNWTDPRTGETTKGFREMGFLPEAFINMLAMLGWNAGTEQEIFTIHELIKHFSMDRVHKGGAKFDFEKAKWFNHQHIQLAETDRLVKLALPYVQEGMTNSTHPLPHAEQKLKRVVEMIKDRCTLLSDFWAQGHFFFATPEVVDQVALKDKWNDNKTAFFNAFAEALADVHEWNHEHIEKRFNDLLPLHNLKKGDVMLPLRLMLVGGKYGPGVFLIAELIGREEAISRIKNAMA